MTRAINETPLRRSGAIPYRSSLHNVTVNDDEEERREARRQTILQNSSSSKNSMSEQSETLKKCLEIYNGNKLSRDNAWSLSLIDTLSTLLDRHHKSLNNFKVAGSSLEASSKVYGLRVDSIHTDVLRLSAGLNAQKYSGRNNKDESDTDGVATGGDGNCDPNASAGGAGDENSSKKVPTQKAKPKRQRKAISTITKNKDTLNGRLDTVALHDPVFAKLNSTVGSINSTNRLMNNILLTTKSELRLRTNFRFWDNSQLEKCDFTEDVLSKADVVSSMIQVPCDRLIKIQFDELKLRPIHTAYVISDIPEVIPDDRESNSPLNISDDDNDTVTAASPEDVFHNSKELSMAFDINAECEPLPALNEKAPIIEIDFGDFNDLTTEERTAIINCRGLCREPVFIEDLRPVDSTSKLEYSYRPIDKISQYWAGPSHWKFKGVRQSSSFTQSGDSNSGQVIVNQRARRYQVVLAKRRSKLLNFSELHDDLFLKLNNKYKLRKVNIQKRWDQRKLKLPTDLRIDPNIFYKYTFAPGIPIEVNDEDMENTLISDSQSADGEEEGTLSTPDDPQHDGHFADDEVEAGNFMNVSTANFGPININNVNETVQDVNNDGESLINNTVLEIATSFEGAPNKVTKIIVPFAKRAKVIDMKSLKRCCAHLITKQVKHPIPTPNIQTHPISKKEVYSEGSASFNDIYKELPQLLSHNMAESLSPAVGFYAILHLANEHNLRLIPHDDLNDFHIRQIIPEDKIQPLILE